MISMAGLTWQNTIYSTHLGGRTLPTATFSHGSAVWRLIDCSSMFGDKTDWKRPVSEVTGFAWHHDAVPFTATSVAAETQRLSAIYNHHTVINPWNGIGYHAVQGNSNRIWIPRKDVLDTHRAHVATSSTDQRRNPPAGTPTWNRQLIGYCLMGDYTQQGTPPEVMRRGADAFFRLVTNSLGKEMSLRPHKFYQNKACPGTWATVDSWADITYLPETPPEPPPAPPEPEPELDMDAVKQELAEAAQSLWRARKLMGFVD